MFMLVSSGVSAWDALLPRAAPRAVQLHNLWDRQVPYQAALDWQRSLHADRVAALKRGEAPPPDTLILLQHPPVLTLGRGR